MKISRSLFLGASVALFLFTACKKSDSNNASNMCTAPAFSYQDSVVKFTLPNVFTPNGDGRNDLFRPVGTHLDTLANYSLTVYNQGGNIAFQTTTFSTGWAPAPVTSFSPATYKYSADLHFTTPGGKTIDTCVLLYVLPTINGCLRVQDTATVKTFVFADQVDLVTGMPIYPTGETMCLL